MSMSFFFEAYRWFLRQAEKHFDFWKTYANEDSSEAISVFCFNASTISSFELTFVDPFSKLINEYFDKKLETVWVNI